MIRNFNWNAWNSVFQANLQMNQMDKWASNRASEPVSFFGITYLKGLDLDSRGL